VIIPARNEEANIARVVRSIAAQGGVPLEIIVADDQSEDRTAAIVERLKAEIPSLVLLRVDLLPEGWMGKAHALACAAKIARGHWLLFTDADTEHLPGSLEATLDRAERQSIDLLSLSPGQLTPTWWEKAIIPLVYVNLARLFRFEDVNDPASPAAAANGQYILVRSEVYRRVGGHQVVRDALLEDVEMARHVKSAGGRLLFLPGAQWVRTRMYRSFGEMWRGWTKNLYLLYGGKAPRILFAVLENCFLDILPLAAAIAAAFAGLLFNSGLLLLLAGSLAVFMTARVLGYRRALQRLGFDTSLENYRILGAVLFSALLLNSLGAHCLRGRVEWKGRTYVAKNRSLEVQ
jgi:glycosyltransferase involved in cell wall biosynthesis